MDAISRSIIILWLLTVSALAQNIRVNTLTTTSGLTNNALTANRVLLANANKAIVSGPANATGALTNDGSGGFGYFNLSLLSDALWTNDAGIVRLITNAPVQLTNTLLVAGSLTNVPLAGTGTRVLTADANGKLTAGPANGVGALTNNGSGVFGYYDLTGVGGSQTPWASDIDGAGFKLTNAGSVTTLIGITNNGVLVEHGKVMIGTNNMSGDASSTNIWLLSLRGTTNTKAFVHLNRFYDIFSGGGGAGVSQVYGLTEELFPGSDYGGGAFDGAVGQALKGINGLPSTNANITNMFYDHAGMSAVHGTTTFFANDDSLPGESAGGLFADYSSHRVKFGVIGIAAPINTNQVLVGIAGNALGDFNTNGTIYVGGYFEATSTNNNPVPIPWSNSVVLLDNRDRANIPFIVARTTPSFGSTSTTKFQVDGGGSVIAAAITNNALTSSRVVLSDANKAIVSGPANAVGALTNNGSGVFGYYDLASVAGSQTPWTSDINAAQFNLTNINKIVSPQTNAIAGWTIGDVTNTQILTVDALDTHANAGPFTAYGLTVHEPNFGSGQSNQVMVLWGYNMDGTGTRVKTNESAYVEIFESSYDTFGDGTTRQQEWYNTYITPTNQQMRLDAQLRRFHLASGTNLLTQRDFAYQLFNINGLSNNTAWCSFAWDNGDGGNITLDGKLLTQSNAVNSGGIDVRQGGAVTFLNAFQTKSVFLQYPAGAGSNYFTIGALTPASQTNRFQDFKEVQIMTDNFNNTGLDIRAGFSQTDPLQKWRAQGGGILSQVHSNGVFRVPDGTAALPAIGFLDDAGGTGFYSPAANFIDVTVGGSPMLRWTSAGNTHIGQFALTFSTDLAFASTGLRYAGADARLLVTAGTSGIGSISASNANFINLVVTNTATIETNIASFDIVTTDFVINTWYTNDDRRASVVIGFELDANTTGTAKAGLYIDQAKDGTFETTLTVQSTAIADPVQHVVTGWLQPNARFAITNLSSGSGSPTATVVAGSSQWVKQ